MDRIEACMTSGPPPSSHEVTNAFWSACHGGQLESARYLLQRGADLNWIGHDRLTPLDAAARNGNPQLLAWLRSLPALSSKSSP
jgi:ankyrin repeat protein